MLCREQVMSPVPPLQTAKMTKGYYVDGHKFVSLESKLHKSAPRPAAVPKPANSFLESLLDDLEDDPFS